MFLFFDTETTGLPLNWKAPVTKLDNWPRMVQIAWLLYDLKGVKMDGQSYIIKPEGYKIPADVAKIHRITTEIAINEGHDLTKVLNIFAELVEEAEIIVAHNISFDEKIVGAEFLRKKVKNSFFDKKRVCTMLSSTDYCKINGPYGYKWPKLSELHYKLFGADFEEAHNAEVDIHATARCFWKLKELGVM
jgi:DNA polymerase III epsilon subunit-like protein